MEIDSTSKLPILCVINRSHIIIGLNPNGFESNSLDFTSLKFGEYIKFGEYERNRFSTSTTRRMARLRAFSRPHIIIGLNSNSAKFSEYAKHYAYVKFGKHIKFVELEHNQETERTGE